MANVVVSALATWNGKALKKGKADVNLFDKEVKKLGKTFAGVFAASKIISFGKSSVNAFLQSERAAQTLRTTIDNLGLSFEKDSIEKYIKGLSLQYGIVDENLIPGFQNLLIVTKNLAAAQSVFDTALNVSAATGKDLTTVATVLGKAYLGDTTALARLGVGIDKASLKTAKFTDVQRKLNTTFAGQARAAASGYVGDVGKLTVAVDQAKEAIGKGLLDALAAVGGDGSIDKLTKRIVTLGEAIGKVITLVAKDLNPSAPLASKYVPSGQALQKKTTGVSLQLVKSQNKLLKDGNALRSLENNQLKAKTEVDKLRDKFDVERIGLMKALNEATDAETILRLQAKIAILDNNEALAKKINAEMEAAKKAAELAAAFGNAANSLSAQIAKMEQMNAYLIDRINQKIAAGVFTPPAGLNIPGIKPLFPTPSGPLGNIDYTVPIGSGVPAYAPGVTPTPMSYADVRLTVDTSSTSDRFAQLIADSLLVSQRTGYSQSAAGSLP